MVQETLLFWLHLLIIIAIIMIPFMPRGWLIYAIYIPAIITAIWLIFDGCPITHMQQDLKEGEGFIHHLFKSYISPTITANKVNNIVTALMTWITLLTALRLLNKK
jgi:hypothetical protein